MTYNPLAREASLGNDPVPVGNVPAPPNSVQVVPQPFQPVFFHFTTPGPAVKKLELPKLVRNLVFVNELISNQVFWTYGSHGPLVGGLIINSDGIVEVGERLSFWELNLVSTVIYLQAVTPVAPDLRVWFW